MKPSRRNLLRLGLALPAAGLGVPGSGLADQGSAAIPYRTLGKTGLKSQSGRFRVGFTPDPA